MKLKSKISLAAAMIAALSGTAVAFPQISQAATTRYEAESAPAVCSGTVASNHSGYSGSGFCDTPNSVGSWAEFTVNSAVAGSVTLSVRYANGSTANRPADIGVNGTVVQPGYAFDVTGSWSTWATRSFTAQLNAGSNMVRLVATTAAGLGNIDYLDVTTPDPQTRYEAESNAAVCDGTIDSDNAGYSGTGFCNTGNATGATIQFTISVTVAGPAALSVRYANGSTSNRPANISVNGAVVQSGYGFEPTGAWTTWSTKTLSAQLNAGSNTILLAATSSGGLANIDYLEVSDDVGSGSIMQGADVSTLQRAADVGARFYYADGTQGDPLDILKSVGVNYVRLRIWNNPASGYNNKAKVLQYAQAVKAKGLKLMIDFHYSDTWADPGKQFKPAAWANYNISQLQTAVYNYTYDVCNSLKAQGTTPDSVQIGNEINTGMLWPEGRVDNSNFYNLGLLLKAGYNATKACNSETQVLIHTARVESGARWFYDGIRAQGVQWDITGLSYYCFWHGGMSNMASVVSDMRSRYGKPVVIAETAYPYTTANADGTRNVVSSGCSGYAVTPAGQQANFAAVQNTARNAGATGIFYWEPTWYAVPGNGWDPADITNSGNEWDNMAVFDRNGRLNADIRWLP